MILKKKKKADDPTGHGTRWEKEKPTGKVMGKQHNGMDRSKVG